MSGWFGFWIFCTMFLLFVMIEDILKLKREKWLMKNGYKYVPESTEWVKEDEQE